MGNHNQRAQLPAVKKSKNLQMVCFKKFGYWIFLDHFINHCVLVDPKWKNSWACYGIVQSGTYGSSQILSSLGEQEWVLMREK